MRGLIVNEFMSLDGVTQAPGAADEDTSGGFKHGGWNLRYMADQVAQKWALGGIVKAGGFLLGRRTYEIFSAYWPNAPEEEQVIAEPLNTKPKYVASSTLTEPEWDDTTVLSDDVAAAVGELKAKPGGELQVHGSGALIRWLLDNSLVDEITLLIVPVVLGQGTRLFPDAGPDIALDLVDSRADSKGVTIQVYRPTGRPQYATATT
jgi:dihydrofolate reductase